MHLTPYGVPRPSHLIPHTSLLMVCHAPHTCFVGTEVKTFEDLQLQYQKKIVPHCIQDMHFELKPEQILPVTNGLSRKEVIHFFSVPSLPLCIIN